MSIEKEDHASVTCPRCGITSYNVNDIREQYCGNCHVFHGKANADSLDMLIVWGIIFAFILTCYVAYLVAPQPLMVSALREYATSLSAMYR